MNLVKTISSTIEDEIQLVKIQRKGKNDIQEVESCAPFGVDSNPIKDMIAIYAQTEMSGENKIIGYINKHAIAETGETRLYSTDSAGTEKAHIWLKSNGDIEINGSDDNLVRYSDLKIAYDGLKSTLNSFLAQWNVFCAAYVPGVSPASMAGAVITPNSNTLDASKIEALKCSSTD